MAENISELLAEIQDLTAKLEKIGFGDDTETVTHNSVTKPTLAGELKSRIDILQSMVQGRKTFETKAALDGFGAPTADASGNFHLSEVWNDSTAANNGIYGWDGSAWILSQHELFSFKSRLQSKLDVSMFDGLFPHSRNLFNPNDEDVVPNKYVSADYGTLYDPEPDTTKYLATGYVSVVPGESYARSYSHNVAFYDSSKVFVSGSSARESVVVIPAGCSFARFTVLTTHKDLFQVEIGTTNTDYVPYGNVVDLGIVGPADTSFFKLTKNLFNKQSEDNSLGSYVLSTSGSTPTNASYNATHFIAVVPGETYTVSFTHQRAFYDVAKLYVSGESSGGKTFVVPAGCYYVRLTVSLAQWDSFQFELGSEATDYAQYGYEIDEVSLPSSLKNLLPNCLSRLDVNPYKPEFLRKTHMKLMKLGLPSPETSQLVINAAGDSYTHNRTRWIQGFTEYLIDRFGDAGGGWCGFGFLNSGNTAPWTLGNQPNYVGGNARSEYVTRLFGSISGTYYNGASPDLAFCTLAQSGDIVKQSMPALPVHNDAELMFIGTADGVIRYTWDDGTSWSSVNTQGAEGAVQVVSLNTSMPAGAGELVIEWVAGAVKLCGVALKSAASGVRVNKLGATGSNISHWANAPTVQFDNSLSFLAADLFIYMDGTNSQSSGISPVAWGDYLDTVYDRVQAATPSTDVLFLTPPENQREGNTVSMASYAKQARLRAASRRFSFNDTQDAFGSADNPTEYGSAGDVPLFSADLIHPDPYTGGRVLMSEVLKCVLKW